MNLPVKISDFPKWQFSVVGKIDQCLLQFSEFWMSEGPPTARMCITGFRDTRIKRFPGRSDLQPWGCLFLLCKPCW